MTGSVALDVVIGLVFVYLLYSLFATLIAEIIATNLMLRARNLKEAVNRMINDEEDDDGTGFPRLMEVFNVFPKNYVNDLIKNFYNHQEVKYLGRKANINPSVIKASNFAKVIIDKIKAVGEGDTDLEKIQSGLARLCLPEGDSGYVEGAQRILGRKTAEYIQSIWQDGEEDLKIFKASLENWFDRTMEQTTQWYKQRMQKILLIIGFGLAWVFNVDTFTLVKTLSVDKDARAQIVQMASSYIENNTFQKYALLTADSLRISGDSTLVLDSATRVLITDYNARLDSLMRVNQVLNADASSANAVLGLGSWLPDSLRQNEEGQILFPDWVNESVAKRIVTPNGKKETFVSVSVGQKWRYLFGLLLGWPRLLGYLITALAISLGAPFWFDILNKLMRLRGVVSEKNVKN
ncbi:hypothetical protein N7E81_12225 [Reichenbachiella carrageenanivorans]|uniref:Uncharacterized protein n=1 Tax=Reichenbachiella carrageenanivorans TaxID=2979869 RepID=A0ABY6D2Q8_9BACT|nr:hypothetical protein [Reichenbachiella carrageenanivorans]UXX78125.1 hypothetical protein N7E81_12225 [Reichenbachiella carrageenanivorans]